MTLLSNGIRCAKLLWSVSVPYKITLLSNLNDGNMTNSHVSVPYKITLLSNNYFHTFWEYIVSVPYEITLLSNKMLCPGNIG